MSRAFWTPSVEAIRASNMDAFRSFVNKRHSLEFKEGDYWSMHEWSIRNPETINDFYNALWDYSGIIGDKGLQPVNRLIDKDNSICMKR
jgi:acetoacetyl-CoA synthetase